MKKKALNLTNASPDNAVQIVFEQLRRASTESKIFPNGIDHVEFEIEFGTQSSFKLKVWGPPSAGITSRTAYTSTWYEETLLREIKNVKVEAKSRNGKIVYDPSKAFDYASEWCHGGNSCNQEYDSDCTHFMCHCLSAGGIAVKNPDAGANCSAGLNVRVEYLAEAFSQLVAQYDNVRRITFDDLTQKGDYGLMKNWIGTPYHAFLLNDRVDNSGQAARIFGHTNNRCGEEAPGSFIDAQYYRIA
jgi:hypothetical protein